MRTRIRLALAAHVSRAPHNVPMLLQVFVATPTRTSRGGSHVYSLFSNVSVKQRVRLQPFARVAAAATLGAVRLGTVRKRIVGATTVRRTTTALGIVRVIGAQASIHGSPILGVTKRVALATSLRTRKTLGRIGRIASFTALQTVRVGGVRRTIAVSTAVRRSKASLGIVRTIAAQTLLHGNPVLAVTKRVVVASGLRMKKALHVSAITSAITGAIVKMPVRRAYVRTYRLSTHAAATIVRQSAVAKTIASTTAAKARTFTNATATVVQQTRLGRRLALAVQKAFAAATGTSMSELTIPNAALLDQPTTLLYARFSEEIDPQ